MNAKPTVTFVSAFIDLKEETRAKYRSYDKFIGLFSQLAESGIALCIFVSPNFKEITEGILAKYNNVKLIEYIDLEDTWTHKTILSYQNIEIPENTMEFKDTFNFMSLMNAKLDFVKKAIDVNPFKTTHFAWIDFCICHVLKDTKPTLKKLCTYAKSALKKEMLVFPACWSKEISANMIKNITRKIHWRFCGGFFMGDANSLLTTYALYQEYFPKFLKETGKLVWEVNFWAWLELNSSWKPDTYIAGHDDTMLSIPSQYMIVNASSIIDKSTDLIAFKDQIDRLLHQIDTIYISISEQHFQELVNSKKTPEYLTDSPTYSKKVKIILGTQFRPESLYEHALMHINKSEWTLFTSIDLNNTNIPADFKDKISDIGIYNISENSVEKLKSNLIDNQLNTMCHMSIVPYTALKIH